MTSIAETFRRQRLQNKLSLDQISLETKISVRLLQAIEAEQFEKLPGGVFRRSFVLQYARALGVDPDETAAALNQLSHFDEVPAIPSPEMIMGGESKQESVFGFPSDLSGVGGT